MVCPVVWVLERKQPLQEGGKAVLGCRAGLSRVGDVLAETYERGEGRSPVSGTGKRICRGQSRSAGLKTGLCLGAGCPG